MKRYVVIVLLLASVVASWAQTATPKPAAPKPASPPTTTSPAAPKPTAPKPASPPTTASPTAPKSATAQPAVAQDPAALIKEFTGKVEVMAPGGTWKPAAKGMKLAKNTAISTGFKSVAVLTLGSSTLTVKPLTKLSLEEIVKLEGSEQVKLYLSAGRVKAAVSAPAGGSADFSVKSPSATASVRGTGFDFDAVNLIVNEGSVAFVGANGQTVYVPAGGISSIGAGGASSSSLQEAVAALAPLLPPGVDPGSFNSLSEVASAVIAALSAGGVDIEVSW
jgi:hypothetical protein